MVKTASEPRSWTTLLWQRSWRRPVVRRGFYEILGLILAWSRGRQILNCGYQEVDFPAIELPPDCEAERLGFQLYHRLASSAPLEGADIVEVGCGRGGGARYLAGHFRPLGYWATDLCLVFNLANHFKRRPRPLRFRRARADRLPFGAHSFDFGLAVEAVHPLRDKAAFLGEMARVLRPGGRLLIADFFYVRESSPNALAGFRAAIAKSAFKVDFEENWTPQALAALEADSPRRLAEIQRLPRVFRKMAVSFACAVPSPLYRQLHDGRAVYAHFELSRR
jgi:ubiquinone/menaquinone biosynthesis C-methylase UbiE